jgi:diguanylate cyclase (GGDEF)-like protein
VTGTEARPRLPPSQGRALALTLVLLAVSATITLIVGEVPLDPILTMPWFALIPLYLLTNRMNLEFVRRGDALTITLSQLPLLLGVVLVKPGLHLLATLIASSAYAAYRRNGLFKGAVNLALVSIELAVPTAAVALVSPVDEPGIPLWSALFIGLIVGEALSLLVLNLVLLLIGRTISLRDVGEGLLTTTLTSAVFSGLGVLAIAAAFTDPWTLLVMAGLGGALAQAYRLHRRVSAQQKTTEHLYELVRGLGPLDVHHVDTVAVLERIRLMLHATRLELKLVPREGEEAIRLFAGPEDAGSGGSINSATGTLDPETGSMATAVMADGTVLGFLTAQERLDTERGFDMRDMRLLETVAAELATALERGRLLRDLGHAASRDQLTGLSNLRRTAEEVDDLLREGPVLLAAVAVDSFREVNDTLGHIVGDELLQQVAKRLQRAAPQAVIGRIGGGRFAVAVRVRDIGEPELFGLSLRTNVEGDVQLGAIGTHVRLSVGCTRGPEHGTDAATLLRRAETAMYSARHAHGGPVIWEPAYEVQGQRRLAVVMALREALASGALGVAYQPKVLSTTGQVTGVEALARWTHPALGSISPDEFVPLAEASGLMGALTSSVLRQALTACKGWQRRGGAVGVAVNVSADTVLDQDFVTEVAAVLTSVGVPAALLTLELTEGVVVADPELAIERMSELRSLGVKLSVDDFGTGYSSLTYLKGLPIDEVKIDKGFVGRLVDDAGDQAVVRAVVDIAHTLGMTVVAEGVEQEDQQSLLRQLGVDQLQGYLFARPMPALGMAAWLRRSEGPAISQPQVRRKI